MKSFKTFLLESAKSSIEKNMPNDKWGEQLTFGEVGRQGLDGSNVGFENAYGLGNIMYATPKNQQRIHAEKNLNTDIGMAFDVDEYGEPIGDLAGFKAVAKRAKEGRSIETTHPPRTFDEYSAEFRGNLAKAFMDLFDPETHKKLGQMAKETLSPEIPKTPTPEETEKQREKNYYSKYGMTPEKPE